MFLVAFSKTNNLVWNKIKSILCFLLVATLASFLTQNTFAQTDEGIQKTKRYYAEIDSLMALKKFSNAIIVVDELINYAVSKYGSFDTTHADALATKAACYTQLRKFDQAILFQNQALAIRRLIPGQEKGCFSALNNLGHLYRTTSLYAKAEPAFVEAIEILEKLSGPNHPDLAVTYSNLGGLYKDIGQFEKSEGAYQKALAINEFNFGVNPIQNAIVYNNLGGLYRTYGNLKMTEYYFFMLYELLRANGGDAHPKTGSALNNLAALYSDMGNVEKSKELYLKSLEITIGKDTATYIASCLNIGIMYSNHKEFENANFYMFKALEFQKLFLHEDDIEIGTSYSNIANLFIEMKDYENAEKYIGYSLEQKEKSLGKTSASYGLSLGALATIKFRTGKYEEAQSISIQAINILKEKLGDKNPTYLNLLRNTAKLFFSIGDLNSAEPYYLQIIELQLNLIKAQFSFLSETEKEFYLKKLSVGFDSFYAFALKRQKENPAITAIAYNSLLNTKGVLLKSSNLMRQTILSKKDGALNDKYESWLALKKKIVNVYNQPIEKRTEDPTILEEQANVIEKELVRESVGFADLNDVMSSSWLDVKSDLKEKEAAIEFTHFKIGDDSIIYCALLVKPESEYPEMIELFEEKQLLLILGETQTNDNKLINTVYGTRSKKNSALYDLIWAPLEKSLSGIDKVYASPSGLLHKISFAGLSKKDGTYLVDKIDIATVSTTHNLSKSNEFVISDSTKISLFGGIQYSVDSSNTFPWQYLNGSKSESDAVANMFNEYTQNLSYLNGADASKINFIKLAEKSHLLHIATHGFFFPDPTSTWNNLTDSSETGDIVFRGGPSRATTNYVNSQNPLMRSGLVFAGANDYWRGDITDNENNGVLTALDVINIDLRETKLVVMSACESGLGDIVDSEGVYGLQRSFKMAGVDFIIMSMWQVPDKETAEFMQLFYKFLFQKNDIYFAFTKAQKIMRKKYDPYYWAAFVLLR